MSYEDRKYSSLAPPLTSNSSTSGINFDTSTNSTDQDHQNVNFNNPHSLINLMNPDVPQTSSTNISTSTSLSSSSSCDQILIPMECQVRLSLQSLSQSSQPSINNPCQLIRTRQNGRSSLAINNIETPDNPRPFLRIVEEPTNRIRYRYKSEKGSHGGLTGENSSQNKKTYPTVKLENYSSTRHVLIKATLFTNESPPRPHVHKLMGKNCNENGVCILSLSDSHTAIFQNLGILFIGKKEVPDTLFQRKLEEHKLICALNGENLLSDIDKERLKEEADREAKRINLNCVRICFQAFDQSENMNFPICEPIFSRPIANQKSPDSGELKIVRMDKYSGICTGNEEVFLLCEKVNKKEIKIRFFETDIDGNQTWEAFANFTEADVHHQVAIVFRTPAYHDLNIDRSVQVYTQLFRPKDGEYSEPRPFTYKPKMLDQELVEKKRKKNSHFNADYSNESFTGFSDQSRYYAQTGSTSQPDPSTNSSETNVVNYYDSILS